MTHSHCVPHHHHVDYCKQEQHESRSACVCYQFHGHVSFSVIDSLQAIHETVTEHHIDGPAKVRCGLIGSGSWRQYILAQSVMEVEMVCNGNTAKKLRL